MIVGAGENAHLVAKYLVKMSPPQIFIANRNIARAGSLTSRLGAGKAIKLAEIPQYINQVDLLISTTASQQPVITCNALKNFLAKRKRPLVVIDLAVPRDVEPQISRFSCVRLYNIDHLNRQITANKNKRLRQIPKAQAIVDDFTSKFADWFSRLDIVPVIAGLHRKYIALADNEASRYAKEFVDIDNRRIKYKLRLFAESLTRKILHPTINFLKSGDAEKPTPDRLQAADFINKLFLSDNRKSKKPKSK